MEFTETYIASRTDVKRSTVIGYRLSQRSLITFFGGDRRLDKITPGETKDFRRWLTRPKNASDSKEYGQGLGENTARKRCSIAKQMFEDALDRELIVRNPFGKMENLAVGASEGRDYFITRDEAKAVLDACPDTQWKLLFALSRFGGLRCPSEHLALRWSDIDWKLERIVVQSPKTERHEGKSERTMPLWPELRPYLEKAWEEASKGAEFVITRYRDTNANLRTQLLRIIAKAKVTKWPKLFQNLRSTRATELAADFPAHVAAEWMGHSTIVADKHYWRVTDADYERAIQTAQHTAQQKASEDTGAGRQEPEQKNEKPGDCENHRVPLVDLVLPDGLEPSTY
jgi:integrase